MKDKTNIMIQFFVFITLLVVTIIRILYKDNSYVPYLNYFSLLIALLTIYGRINTSYKDHENIDKFNGFVFIFIATPIAILTGLIVGKFIVINDTWSDAIALFALAISVPSDFVIKLISSKLFKEKK